MPRRGPRPRWCSEACKQAAYRERHRERIAAARREAYATARQRARVAWFHQRFHQIGSDRSLGVNAALELMWELAGRDDSTRLTPKQAYRRASRRWHPDVPEGDETVFKLLQAVYRVLVASHPDWHRQ
uniref:J domain-containing protein n=1 Tax=Amycolatopsis sp. CA-096443 TaxID=3239919 RepID=UPI003F495A58